MMSRRRSIREAMLEIELKERNQSQLDKFNSFFNSINFANQTPTSLMALAALMPKRNSYYGMRIDLMSGRNCFIKIFSIF